MTDNDVYDLYSRGLALLSEGHNAQAAVPLERARRLEPDKTSIREALGRAYFLTGAYAKAAGEFEAIVEHRPTDDYAQFCLGRSLEKLGRRRRARHHLAVAAGLRPERRDYRAYRDRLRAA